MKVIFFALLMNIYAHNLTFKPQQVQLITANINYYSALYDLDKTIITKLVAAESNFDTKAKSNKNAYGLMQLQPATANEIAKKLNITDYDLYDVQTNINLGCYYLRYLINYYGNYKEALIAYNMGMGAYKRRGKAYLDTLEYVNKILGEEND